MEGLHSLRSFLHEATPSHSPSGTPDTVPPHVQLGIEPSLPQWLGHRSYPLQMLRPRHVDDDIIEVGSSTCSEWMQQHMVHLVCPRQGNSNKGSLNQKTGSKILSIKSTGPQWWLSQKNKQKTKIKTKNPTKITTGTRCTAVIVQMPLAPGQRRAGSWTSWGTGAREPEMGTGTTGPGTGTATKETGTGAGTGWGGDLDCGAGRVINSCAGSITGWSILLCFVAVWTQM